MSVNLIMAVVNAITTAWCLSWRAPWPVIAFNAFGAMFNFAVYTFLDGGLKI